MVEEQCSLFLDVSEKYHWLSRKQESWSRDKCQGLLTKCKHLNSFMCNFYYFCYNCSLSIKRLRNSSSSSNLCITSICPFTQSSNPHKIIDTPFWDSYISAISQRNELKFCMIFIQVERMKSADKKQTLQHCCSPCSATESLIRPQLSHFLSD